jgi:hypothetical protein
LLLGEKACPEDAKKETASTQDSFIVTLFALLHDSEPDVTLASGAVLDTILLKTLNDYRLPGKSRIL